MTPDEYVAQRLDDQVAWYDGKSLAAQTSFKWLRRAEIAAAAVIPLLAGFATDHPAVPIAIGILGAIVVVLAAFQSLGQYHENWLEYRTTCESLKHEKFLFLTKSEPYDSDNAFALFVERVESLVSKENSAWAQHTRVAVKASKLQDRDQLRAGP